MTDPAQPDATQSGHAEPARHGASADRVDPDHPRGANPFDQADHFTGEDYHIDRERAEGRARPSGQEDRVATGGDPALPPEQDNRASFDPKTGAVHQPKLPEDGGLPSA